MGIGLSPFQGSFSQAHHAQLERGGCAAQCDGCRVIDQSRLVVSGFGSISFLLLGLFACFISCFFVLFFSLPFQFMPLVLIGLSFSCDHQKNGPFTPHTEWENGNAQFSSLFCFTKIFKHGNR